MKYCGFFKRSQRLTLPLGPSSLTSVTAEFIWRIWQRHGRQMWGGRESRSAGAG